MARISSMITIDDSSRPERSRCVKLWLWIRAVEKANIWLSFLSIREPFRFLSCLDRLEFALNSKRLLRLTDLSPLKDLISYASGLKHYEESLL